MTATARDRLTGAEFEAFLKLPENQERRFELYNKQIIPKMVTEEHGVIVANLVFGLKRYLAEHPIGRLSVEVAIRCPISALLLLRFFRSSAQKRDICS